MFNHLKEMNELIAMLKDDIGEIERHEPHDNGDIEELQIHLKTILKQMLEQRTRHIVFTSCTILFTCGVVMSIINLFLQNSMLQVCVFSSNAIGCMILLPITIKPLKKYYWALLALSFIMIVYSLNEGGFL